MTDKDKGEFITHFRNMLRTYRNYGIKPSELFNKTLIYELPEGVVDSIMYIRRKKILDRASMKDSRLQKLLSKHREQAKSQTANKIIKIIGDEDHNFEQDVLNCIKYIYDDKDEYKKGEIFYGSNRAFKRAKEHLIDKIKSELGESK